MGYRGVGQNSSSVQMASAYHVGAAVLAHVARSGQLDSALDERRLRDIQWEYVLGFCEFWKVGAFDSSTFQLYYLDYSCRFYYQELNLIDCYKINRVISVIPKNYFRLQNLMK